MKRSALGGGSPHSHRHHAAANAMTTLVDAASWTASSLACYVLGRSNCFIIGDLSKGLHWERD